MGDYERSATVDADRDELFEYLSKIDNLPQYMDRITQAHSLAGDRVGLEARIEPGDVGSDGMDASDDANDPENERTVHGEGWFRIDADQRMLRWGSEGPNDYSGELAVSGDEASSVVRIRVHTLHDDADGIESGIEDTLANIQRIASSHPELNPGTSTS